MSNKKQQTPSDDHKKSTKVDQAAPTKDWAAVKGKPVTDDKNQHGAPESGKASDQQQESKSAPPKEQDSNKSEQELSRLKEQLADYKDIVLRSKAEVENMRLRTQKEVERAHAFGLERFAKALLAVVDSLEKALDGQEKDQQDSGLKITYDMFIKVLDQFHLVQVGAKGDVFDASVHEAISVQPSDDVASSHIVNVVRTGYTLNGRVIRPAMVVVAK
jgi:molecular chaperone GrpE